MSRILASSLRILVGGRCFVAMPFSEGFSEEVYDAIGPALKDFDITCYRADEVIRGGEVMTDVLRCSAVG